MEIVKTQDYVPVRHGYWKEYKYVYCDDYYVCSECEESWVLNDGTPADNNMNYCPNCGARMDGERRDSDGTVAQ